MSLLLGPTSPQTDNLTGYRQTAAKYQSCGSSLEIAACIYETSHLVSSLAFDFTDPCTTKHLVSPFSGKRREEMFRNEFYGSGSEPSLEKRPDPVIWVILLWNLNFSVCEKR